MIPKHNFYRFTAALLIAMTVLSACAPSTASPTAQVQTQVVLPSATIQPASTPTTTLTPILTPPSTATTLPTATLTAAPTIQTYTVLPDDAAQAKVRVLNCVFNNQGLDVFINGQQAESGGMPSWMPSNGSSGYIYLMPGKVQLTAAPSSLDNALFPPQDLTLEAGHRYTVVILGEQGDNPNNTLFIDETKTIKNAGATPDQYTFTVVNNLKGAASIDHMINGKTTISIPYEAFKTEVLPHQPVSSDQFIVGGKRIDQGDPTPGSPEEGSVDSIGCWLGDYPGTLDQDYTWAQTPEESSLGLLDYLKHFTDQNQALHDSSNSYATFLALVKEAGMEEILNKTPHLVFVPSDKAFSLYMQKADLAALQADPKAAGTFLKDYIVEGFYPWNLLPPSGMSNTSTRTLIAMSGASLKITLKISKQTESFSMNGEQIGNEWDSSLFTANGSRIWYINQMISPQK